MDGLEATRRIRLDPRFKELPIIAMTAGAMAEEREETVRAGMNDYITKPIDIDQMFATIARWLRHATDQGAVQAAEPADTPMSWPGLDVEFGLKSVFNKVTLYRKLLRSYLDSSVTSSQKFDAAMAAGDRKELNRLAHTLKGGGGTLGLHGVYEAAVALEKADPAASPEELGKLLAVLKAEQDKALGSINRYLMMS